MSILLIKLTQYLLCIVSMLLTGLFAMGFAPTVRQDWSLDSAIPALMVLIGVSIDLGKYLFWHARARHVAFLLISVILLAFSWTASVAFFVTQEKSGVEQARVETTAYRLHNTRIENLRELIGEKRQLAKKRLESQYHEQWDKSEQLLREASDLEREMTNLLLAADSVGLEAVRRSRSTSAFFSVLSELSGIPATIVYVICYALMALMIEVCSFGMISLSEGKPAQSRNLNEKEKEKSDPSEIVKEATLRRDILNGITAPVTRRIIKTYRMQHSSVKKVLEQLLNDGYLRKQNRMYVLN